MGKSKAPESEVIETPLSREQLSILRDRESFYQKFAVPAMKEHYNQVMETELRNDYKTSPYQQIVSQNVGDVRQQFGVQSDRLNNSMAQRGLEGSGVEANILSQFGAAQANAVGNTVNQTQLKALLERNNIISQQNNNSLAQDQIRQSALRGLLSQAPQSTMAATMGTFNAPGKADALGATIGGGMQGAMVGSRWGPWGAVAGAVVGGAAGYGSTT